ncbi:SDR family NAD(P)-dependent oxidoreductase [Amycolatopsis sp. PS_44_ISF1]|uniref:SDR family NAD(P)-dependent oxidoreductase n=1 Tax=Amycolatopsis sp. PS_44_ISF1 TaxID=2974917 RepID=UPI0028DD7485|nr:SDR family NAD(P)-dependent oxidoreductase [Amycolatopsis sp. PS_44_ISF1]MDT8912861.1 SDR family NAD(P)-dependent oxidoreductase [Amycolatopsis sp. PS_44_ISF1]
METTTVLVTGGNAGIGYFIAEQLAARGVTVVIGSRSADRAEAALGSIRAQVPGARVRYIPLDLADLPSLEGSVDALELSRLDAVVHNAGVLLEGPQRRETAAGHELTFGTNHLGHFALTHWLAPLLADGGRIVTTGSFTAKRAKLDFGDLQSRTGYDGKRTYARSKLAQMLFGFELDRRLRAHGSNAISVVTHPGGALDSLTPSRPPLTAGKPGPSVAGLLLQGKDAGAWPSVHAVVGPEVTGGQLWGPRGLGLRGRPRSEPVRGSLADHGAAARIWAASVELTGLDPFG